MAIYDIFEVEKEEEAPTAKEDFSSSQQEPEPEETCRKRDRFFSALAARLFFFLLLIGDVLWFGYSMLMFAMNALLSLITLRRVEYFKEASTRAWISVRRSLVCALALFIALFSPAFGIMVACTYFLMYDKSGIEEVVPSSLQSQFKEFFKNR